MQIILSNDYTDIKAGLESIASPNWATIAVILLTVTFWLLDKHADRSYKNAIKKKETVRKKNVNTEIDEVILGCMNDLIDSDFIINAKALKKQLGNGIALVNKHSDDYENLKILNSLHKFKAELEDKNSERLMELALQIVEMLEVKKENNVK